MAKRNWKRGSWVVTIPLLAAIVGYGTLVFLPNQRNIETLRHTLAAKRDAIQRAESLKPTMLATRDKLQKSNAFGDAWRSKSTLDANDSTVYGEFSAQADVSGVETSQFDPLPPVEMQAIRRIPIAWTVHGSFPQVFSMLSKLERLPYTICIDGLRIESNEDESNDVTCDLKLDVIVTANQGEKEE